MAKSIFFLGKGGVGKSTTAVLTSIHYSNKGKNVLLASLDPAHNLSDIINRKLSDKPLVIKKNLSMLEVDNEYWIKRYLNNIENKIQQSYNYLTALNLSDQFKIIRYSPGIEEYGLIAAYESILREFSQYDYILFDMPPTALTLKFFSLPSLSMLWLERLLALRKEINEKKEVISKIKFGKLQIETDKIMMNLNNQLKYYKDIKDDFENKNLIHINLILNPDKLAISESKLIIKKLSDLNLVVDQYTANNIKSNENFDFSELQLNIKYLQEFPFSKIPLIGLNRLQEYLNNVKMINNI